jgi:hypothetical protein
VDLCSAHDQDHIPLHKALKKATQKAKREWANSIISNAKNEELWQVTKWRHSQWVSFILAILTNQGLSSEDPTKAEAFQARFFNNHPLAVPDIFPDDPPPLLSRDLAMITQEEIATALFNTSNKSAPGPSGQGYLLIKWAFLAHLECLTHLYNACLRLGHHPFLWKEAMAVVIPKPNQMDPSLPKNYHPISFL